ncbi:PadR family transcriptional regulator [Paenibacillus sp. FSL H7-0331]|uniref:PadR family transcriptional regulator n=1 Tax=Paenibacillus sp. FSL H7-0331 TaxID=1920421 RepID=UPI00096F339E|nr:PadR family transcriptional regulator [Paenibacillus sp. FSL H7-0331]OME94515.1 hypothetical protein BK127_41495 [Paenibacillus sp. FSL H7-0331]
MFRITVLGLLSKKPMHGYEIQQILEFDQVELWTNLQVNKIYHAIRQMEKEQLIKVHSTDRNGNRSRVLYNITEAGKAELTKEIEKTLCSPTLHFPSKLYTAVSFISQVPKQNALICIQKHIVELEKSIKIWEEGELKKINLGIKSPNFLKAVFMNGINNMKADIKLLYEIRDHIDELY